MTDDDDPIAAMDAASDKALAEMRAAEDEEHGLRETVADLRAEVADLTRERDEAVTDRETMHNLVGVDADGAACVLRLTRERDEARAALAEAARWAAHRTAEIAELLTERGEANADLSTARTESASAVAALAAAEETIETLRGECGADGHAPWCREWARMQTALAESEAREAALREAINTHERNHHRDLFAACRACTADPSPRSLVLLAAVDVAETLCAWNEASRKADHADRPDEGAARSRRDDAGWAHQGALARYEAADAAAQSPARPVGPKKPEPGSSDPTPMWRGESDDPSLSALRLATAVEERREMAAAVRGEPDALTRAAIDACDVVDERVNRGLVACPICGWHAIQDEHLTHGRGTGCVLVRYEAAKRAAGGWRDRT